MMRDAAVPSLLGILNAFRDRLVAHLHQVKVVEKGRKASISAHSTSYLSEVLILISYQARST
jgi:hypothetical protein